VTGRTRLSEEAQIAETGSGRRDGPGSSRKEIRCYPAVDAFPADTAFAKANAGTIDVLLRARPGSRASIECAVAWSRALSPDPCPRGS